MLLLLFTLFSYDVINCFNETIVKEKFNESSVLSKYRHNFLEVQAFIIDAQHKFHGNQTAKQGDNTLRLTRFKEVDRPPGDSLITGELDQKTLQTSIPLLRSRPVFPGSITPFTTELNARHLDWDKIFPSSTVQTKPVASRLAFHAPGIPTSSPGPSSTEPEHYELSYPSFSVSPRDFVWNMSTVRTVKPSATTNTTLAPIKYINDEVMNLWLQEITTFSPVDKLMNTLTDNGYTTERMPDVARTSKPKAKTPARVKKPQDCSRGRPEPSKGPGHIYLLHEPLDVKGGNYTQPPFYEPKSRIPLKTTLKKNAGVKTTAVKKKPVKIPVTPKFNGAKGKIPLKTTLKKNAAVRTTAAGKRPVKIPVKAKVIEAKSKTPLKTILKKNAGVRTTAVKKKPVKIPVTPKFNKAKGKIPLKTTMKKNAAVRTTAVKKKPVKIPVTPKFNAAKGKIPLKTTLKKNAGLRTTTRKSPVKIPVTARVNKAKSKITLGAALKKNVYLRTTAVWKRPSNVPHEAWFFEDKTRIRLRAQDRNEDIRTTVISETPGDAIDSVTATFFEDESGIPLETALEKNNEDTRTTLVSARPDDSNVPVAATFFEDTDGIPLRTSLEKKNEHINTTVVSARPDDANVPVTASFFEDTDGISFRTSLEKKNANIRTTLVGERHVLVMATTAEDVFPSGLYIQEQYSHDQSKSPVKTRNFHTKVRRRKPHHHSYKRNRRRQRYRHRNSREDIYRRKNREEENPMMRRKKEMEYRRRISTDKKKRGSKRKRLQINTFLPRLVIGSSDSEEPEEAFDSSNEMSQHHHYQPEDEIHIKRIGKRDESRHKGVQRRAQKEKLFKELMERLKAVESRKKVKQTMLKADRLRKIVEGSSYSDEEEPLKKNLILALNYGNRT